MKILYAIQGTGNGHLSRARDIIPVLQKKGDVDILISGTQADVELPYHVKYKFKGLSFVFGKKGGVDLLETYKKSNLKQLYAEIKSLPIEEYDVVINDFEPVSAWACRLQNKECVGLSHQLAVLNKKSPKPKSSDVIGKVILKNYAPVTKKYGFHFSEYDKNIFTPVVREQIRKSTPVNYGHYTVYLPAYDDKRIIKVLKEIKNIKWCVFSKHSKKGYKEKNIHIVPINNDAFIESLRTCEGMLCGAGFETPAEALFLQKKLLVIPMKGQYEQQCNAAALKKMEVPVLKNFKLKHLEKINNWIKSKDTLTVHYPNITEKIIDTILQQLSAPVYNQVPLQLGKTPYSVKRFKQITLEKMINQISGN